MISPPTVITTPERLTAVIRLTIPCQDMGTHMDPAIQELIRTITGQGIAIIGPMFCYHHRRPSDMFDFEIGFPVAQAIKPEGRVINSKLPAVQVVRSVYQGPYEGLAQAWPTLQNWVCENLSDRQAGGHGETGKFWESYLNNPDEVKDPKEYRTELNWIVNAL